MHPREWVSLRLRALSSSWLTALKSARFDSPQRCIQGDRAENLLDVVKEHEENALRDTHSLRCILVTTSHRVWRCFPFLHAYVAVVGPYRSVLRIGLYGPGSADHPPWRCI